METLPRGNGWKLMTTGDAAGRKCLILAPLTVPPAEKSERKVRNSTVLKKWPELTSEITTRYGREYRKMIL